VIFVTIYLFVLVPTKRLVMMIRNRKGMFLCSGCMLLPVLTSSVCNCSPELSSDDDDSDEPLSVKEATQPLKKENKRLSDELQTLKAKLQVLLIVLIVSNPFNF
jgi:hypothetical protein